MLALGYGLAVLIGLSLGLLGGGGAILTVPVLVYALGLGMKQAVPTSLVIVGLTSLTGAVHHRRAGTLDGRVAATFGPAAVAGALAGARAALAVSGRTQLTVFAVVLLVAAAFMFKGPPQLPHQHRSVPLFLAIGAAVGFLTGFIGVGGGFLYVPALVLLAGLEMKAAVGTSLALIALSSAAGLAGYLGRVELDWLLIGGFAALALVGVGIGSRLVPHVPQERLRRGFVVLLFVMGTVILVVGK